MSEPTPSSTSRVQTPEEVARAALLPPLDDPDRPDTSCTIDASEWYAYALRHAERVIRARDAEVRADERGRCSVVHATLDDEQLVDELVRRGVLEEKREDHLRPARVPCDCEHPTHAGLIGDDAPPTHAATQVVPVVQYATPWKRDTRTDEQRSDDAIDELRRRLTGDA